MRALCVQIGSPPQTWHAACHEKHDAVEKGEDESSCLQWHRHTHAERERPTHTTLTHSHAQPEGGEEKKEDKKTGTTLE